MRRVVRAVVLSLAVVLPLSACSPGLAANPRYATDSGAGPQGAPETSDQPAGPPAVEAPKNELSWRDCTSRVFASASVPPLPGVKLDCASYDADLDSINGASGTVSIGVVRATSQQTPADAGPLVMTTGSDVPSSVQLPAWLSRAGADVLKTNPIVSVDRRGIGMSGALDCRDLFDRQEMFEQAQFQSGDDPVANLGAVTMTATTSCTDTIAPGDSAYDNAHAAEDIERLRTTWDVPALALFGVGNGAQVALAYAGAHPTKVARLVLDSPLPLGVSAEAATEQRVKGEQAALDAWATQCVATNCPLGPDPKAAVDALNRPTPDRVRELVVAWGKMYPQFGTTGALDMVKCLNWPSGSAPAEPSELEIPTLLLGVANDPIVGNEGVAAVAATAINAGSSNRRVIWQGIGHGAAIYSPCALPPVLDYLTSGELPSTDTYCPA